MVERWGMEYGTLFNACTPPHSLCNCSRLKVLRVRGGILESAELEVLSEELAEQARYERAKVGRLPLWCAWLRVCDLGV